MHHAYPQKSNPRYATVSFRFVRFLLFFDVRLCMGLIFDDATPTMGFGCVDDDVPNSASNIFRLSSVDDDGCSQGDNIMSILSPVPSEGILRSRGVLFVSSVSPDIKLSTTSDAVWKMDDSDGGDDGCS